MLLAGGTGTRAAPLDKLLLRDPRGRSVFERSFDAARNGPATRMAVVLGHEAERLLPFCAAADVVVTAADHRQGLSASLKRGIAVARVENWAAVLVFLADMPFVVPDTAAVLVEAWRTGGTDAVVPVHGGRDGHPVLWDRAVFDRLEALAGDTGGRVLLRDGSVRVQRRPVADEGILIDLDTPARLASFVAGERPAAARGG